MPSDALPATDVLHAEAVCLHRRFFGGEPPPEVTERYIAANVLCCPGSSELMNGIVARGLDAEAVELALRLTKGRGVLTTKIQILFYLMEVRSSCYTFFVGNEETRSRAALGLIGAVLQTAAKYLKGLYLIRRYRLC